MAIFGEDGRTAVTVNHRQERGWHCSETLGAMLDRDSAHLL